MTKLETLEETLLRHSHRLLNVDYYNRSTDRAYTMSRVWFDARGIKTDMFDQSGVMFFVGVDGESRSIPIEDIERVRVCDPTIWERCQ